jgi:hypothetical protein
MSCMVKLELGDEVNSGGRTRCGASGRDRTFERARISRPLTSRFESRAANERAE